MTAYIPTNYFALTYALLDFWEMLEQGHAYPEACAIYNHLIVTQAIRAEVACQVKSPRYIERAVTFDDLYEARWG